MGKVIINETTPKNPLTLIGKMIAPCYGSDSTDDEKNYKRGLRALKDRHFRCLEFATAWFTLEDYSARVIREFYTHLGGAPTRVQASTRYIEYGDFDYIIPPSIACDQKINDLYVTTMEQIQSAVKTLEMNGVAKEDAANLLPLGMTTTVSCHYNARTLMDMSRVRLCNRAYWEYGRLMRDIIKALSEYSEEWHTICKMLMYAKCVPTETCNESHGCGMFPYKKQ